jgi:hypothetical protein
VRKETGALYINGPKIESVCFSKALWTCSSRRSAWNQCTGIALRQESNSELYRSQAARTDDRRTTFGITGRLGA